MQSCSLCAVVKGQRVPAGQGRPAALPAPLRSAASLSVRELQERLDLLDVKYDDCVEKRELVERYKATAAERAQDFFAGRGQASGTLY